MISLYILFVLLLLLLSLIFILINFTKNKNNITNFDEAIRTLYRQCARWAVASIQDDSEIIRLLHANYAAGYLWAIKDIVSTEDFFRITGVKFLDLESKIVAIQDEATFKLVNKCGKLVFQNDPLLQKAIYSKYSQ